MSDHRANEATSLEYHKAIAERLRNDPAILRTARSRVEEWIREGIVSDYYAEAWQAILDLPPAEVIGYLTDRGEKACALRQVSPFAGVLDARERWAIWRQARGTSDNDPSAA
jgi:hypothetical protein